MDDKTLTNQGNKPPTPPPFPSEDLEQTVPPPDQPEETAGKTKEKANENNFNLPPVIATSQGGKKFGGRQIIATILGLLLLVGAVGAGVTLVQRNQDIREQAATSCEPEIWDDYSKYPIDPADCEYAADGETFRTCYEKYKKLGCQAAPADPQDDLACAKVTRRLATKYGYPSYECGATAKELAYINCTNAMGVFERWCLGTSPTPTATPTPTGTPPTGAQCLNIRVFDTDWNEITISEFSSLSPGDTIRFTVAGTTTSGEITKARFTINNTTRPEVTQKRPGTNEFYDEYTIPAGTTALTVDAELFHSTLGWF